MLHDHMPHIMLHVDINRPVTFRSYMTDRPSVSLIVRSPQLVTHMINFHVWISFLIKIQVSTLKREKKRRQIS